MSPLTATAVRRPRVYGDYFGLSVTMPSKEDCDLGRAMGFRWIRGGAESGWGPNAINQQIDVAAHAKSIGVRFVWCSNLSTHTYTLDRLKEWEGYHTWLAAVGIKWFEMGNEWNNNEFFKPYDPNWALQSVFMDRAAAAVKAVNPLAKCITGGMSSYGNDDGSVNNRWPQRAVPMLVARLNRANWDGVGNHLYSFPEDPQWTFPEHPGWGATSRNRDVWDSIKATGLRIYNTEFGSRSDKFSSERLRRDHWEQYIAELDDQRKNYGVKFGAHFVHTLRDGTSFIQGQETGTFGIVKLDGSLKSPTTEYFTDLLKKVY